MKRAVSSIDASAQAAPARLKRCKSAFANLTRLGGAAATSPTTPPREMESDDEEAVLQLSWRQQVSSTDVNSAGSGCGGGGGGGARGAFVVGGSRCALPVVPIHHSSHHQQQQIGFTPHPGTGAERRLFSSGGGSAVGNSSHGYHSNQDSTAASGRCGIGGGGNGVGRGRSSSRKNSFTSAFGFSPVPEGEISTGAGGGGGRCPFLYHQQQQHLQQQQQHLNHQQQVEMNVAGGAGGLAVPPGSAVGAGGEHARSYWHEPSSPAFSIVGFDEYTSEDDEECAWSSGTLSYSAAVTSSYSIANPEETSAAAAAVASARGDCGRVEGLAAVSHSTSPAGPTAVASASGVAAASTRVRSELSDGPADKKQTAPAVGEAVPPNESPSSPLLLLRLQRRFEEMLLVSNVAT